MIACSFNFSFDWLDGSSPVLRALPIRITNDALISQVELRLMDAL
jgi:hypothetical protein